MLVMTGLQLNTLTELTVHPSAFILQPSSFPYVPLQSVTKAEIRRMKAEGFTENVGYYRTSAQHVNWADFSAFILHPSAFKNVPLRGDEVLNQR
jgi:hypothetical protein